MIPAEWAAPPEKMHATPLKRSELNRGLKALKIALSLYPASMMRDNLKDIYLVEGLYDYGELVGGMENADDHSMYLCLDRDTSDEFFTSVFHHEFAHLLLDHNEAAFNRRTWERYNTPGFRYGNGGIDSIKKKKDSDEPNESYWKQGFLSQYAMSDIDEDFASLAEYLFANSMSNWAKLEAYPRMKAKVSHVLAFYHALSPAFSRTTFNQPKVNLGKN